MTLYPSLFFKHWSVGWICSYKYKTKIKDKQKCSCCTKTTQYFLIPLVSYRDLTHLFFYDLKNRPRHCKISKIHISRWGNTQVSLRFLQDTHKLVLKTMVENVQWHQWNAYYFEIYFHLIFFLFLTTPTWTKHPFIPQTCKKLWQLN